jgi:hypothetical protein
MGAVCTGGNQQEEFGYCGPPGGALVPQDLSEWKKYQAELVLMRNGSKKEEIINDGNSGGGGNGNGGEETRTEIIPNEGNGGPPLPNHGSSPVPTKQQYNNMSGFSPTSLSPISANNIINATATTTTTNSNNNEDNNNAITKTLAVA